MAVDSRVNVLTRWAWGDRPNDVVRLYVVGDEDGMVAKVYGACSAGVEVRQEVAIASVARNPRGGYSLKTTDGATWTTKAIGCSCRIPPALKGFDPTRGL